MSDREETPPSSVRGTLLSRLRTSYAELSIAGKLNRLLLVMMALIATNSLIVFFSLFFIYTRNESLSTLERFVEQVDQVEISQLRFRLTHQRADALNTSSALIKASALLDTLPSSIFNTPGAPAVISVTALLRALDQRFGEYLMFQEQTAALESGMRKIEEGILSSMKNLRAGAGQDGLNLTRAQLVQSVLDARIIQQTFAIERDMSLAVRMAQSINTITSAAANLRAQSLDIGTQIEAYNIGQQALLLGSTFDKLQDYTKRKLVNEQSMSADTLAISQRTSKAASHQRDSIATALFLVVISVLSVSLVIVISGFVFGHWFVRGITVSLSQLVQFSRKIAHGDYQQEPMPTTHDEIGELTGSFGEMAHTVQQQIDALRESEYRVRQRTTELETAYGSLALAKEAAEALNESLEAKVLERTEALEEANRKLAELTVTDALTGLSNRRRFDQVIADEWSRASRTGQSLAIVMIDVDHFKAYNDHYGHQAGDDCLRKVAHVLMSGARRASDLVARYGGEEFVIVAADSDIKAAQELAETLRRSVEALAIPHEFSPANRVVTVSVGVSVTTPDGNMQAESLLRMADAALYYAKDGGRNRVAAWGSVA